ncbi:MAG: LysM peptidoglycan-binding domain-containing protein, partial [Candidatus Dojkabacteria bacterium]
QEQVDEESDSEEGNGEEANGSDADESEERDEEDQGSVEGEEDSAADTGEGNVNEDAPGASTEAAATEGLVAGRFERTDVSYSRGNDYSFGDISGNTYTIKRGDTLWQIAEGRYGSGLAWTEINEANGGFKLLPNGTPVFLRVGEQITLPDLE